MKAATKAISWLIRLFEDEKAKEEGIFYEGVCTVTIDPARVASVQGLVAPEFDAETWNSVNDELWSIGARKLLYMKKTCGNERLICRDLLPPKIEPASAMLSQEQREEISRILEIVAKDGLHSPHDLDVALDAIQAAIFDVG